MAGKHSRNKGAGYEREVVNELKDNGIAAERVPLSGAMKGNYGGDIKIGPTLGYIGECKRKKKGFTSIYNAFNQDNADLLFCRDDGEKTFVSMRMETFVTMARQLGWIDE